MDMTLRNIWLRLQEQRVEGLNHPRHSQLQQQIAVSYCLQMPEEIDKWHQLNLKGLKKKTEYKNLLQRLMSRKNLPQPNQEDLFLVLEVVEFQQVELKRMSRSITVLSKTP